MTGKSDLIYLFTKYFFYFSRSVIDMASCFKESKAADVGKDERDLMASAV